MGPAGSSPVRLLPLCALTLVFAAMVLAEPGLALAMAPAIGILLLLFSGRRPGEDLIERLATRRHRPAPRRRAARTIVPATPQVVRPTGRLIAFALAIRPPPAQPA